MFESRRIHSPWADCSGGRHRDSLSLWCTEWDEPGALPVRSLIVLRGEQGQCEVNSAEQIAILRDWISSF